MFKEFKEFALRGNVIDLAVGIIIGGADGNFDEHERGVVRDMCFAVGISPAEFDL